MTEVVFKINDERRVLKLTGNHMIYIQGDQVIPARDLCVNDFIKTTNGFSKIIQINQILGTGVIAPITYSGNIIVNDVHVSCYTDDVALWKSNCMMKCVYYPLRCTSLCRCCHNSDRYGIPNWAYCLIYSTCNWNILNYLYPSDNTYYDTFNE